MCKKQPSHGERGRMTWQHTWSCPTLPLTTNCCSGNVQVWISGRLQSCQCKNKFVPCHRKRKSRVHRSSMARALFTPSPSMHTPTSEDHQAGYVNSYYILWLHYSSQTQVISYLRKAVFVLDGHGAKIGRGLFIRKGTLVHLCTLILLLPSRVGRDCCRLDAVTL